MSERPPREPVGPDPERPIGLAIVLPGGSGYTVDHPLLWCVSQVLAESGWRVATELRQWSPGGRLGAW